MNDEHRSQNGIVTPHPGRRPAREGRAARVNVAPLVLGALLLAASGAQGLAVVEDWTCGVGTRVRDQTVQCTWTPSNGPCGVAASVDAVTGTVVDFLGSGQCTATVKVPAALP